MTAVQYTSGGAKMRSSRRRVPLWNGEEGGRMNTVRAFSSESQWCVRSGLCPWKPETSAVHVGWMRMMNGIRGIGRTHHMGDHTALMQSPDEPLAQSLDLRRVGMREDDIDIVALRLASSIPLYARAHIHKQHRHSHLLVTAHLRLTLQRSSTRTPARTHPAPPSRPCPSPPPPPEESSS